MFPTRLNPAAAHQCWRWIRDRGGTCNTYDAYTKYCWHEGTNTQQSKTPSTKLSPLHKKNSYTKKNKPAHKTKKSYHLSSPTTPTSQISHACYTKTGTWSRRTQSYHKPSQKNQSQPSPDKPTYETYSYGATLVAQNLLPSPSPTPNNHD